MHRWFSNRNEFLKFSKQGVMWEVCNNMDLKEELRKKHRKGRKMKKPADIFQFNINFTKLCYELSHGQNNSKFSQICC